MCDFGEIIRQRDFYFLDGYAYLNHGSYGAVPKPVHETKLRLMKELEQSPDFWFHLTSDQKWKENRQAVADFLVSDVENIVLVNNATTACNAVVKSLIFEEEESILVNSYTYGAVSKACQAATSQSGGRVTTLQLPLELDKQRVIDLYKDALANKPKIKLVILDVISSFPAIRFPIKELIAICRENNKLVLVDGAHVPGQEVISLNTLDADFFICNFHKWMYTPRGCGALWVHPKFHHIVKPCITSHGYKSGTLQGDFYWQGTLDNTSIFCAQKAIEYFYELGGNMKISSYCTALLEQAADMLTVAWNTQKFPIGRDLEAPYLRLVELPHLNNFRPADDVDLSDMQCLMKVLYVKYRISTVCLEVHGRNWVRLSASVYNTFTDYEKLRDAILDISKQNI